MKDSWAWLRHVVLLNCLLLFGLARVADAQTLTLSASPASVTIHPGDLNVPVTITASSSASPGPFVIVMTGLPSGVSASSLTVSPGASGVVTLSATKTAGAEGFVSTSPSSPTTYTTQVTVDAVSSAVQASTKLALSISLTNPAFAPAASNIDLPVVNINTGGTTIATADIAGTITITSADGGTSYLPNAGDTDTTATFHVRGNTTAVMPKKPYAVKLNTSLDLLTTMGYSCPYVSSKGKAVCDKSKSYALLANYDDKTLLRDWSASQLANAIPIGNGYLDSMPDSPTPSGTGALMPWAPHSLFVELYINGQYQGNYQLIEKPNVDGNRININELAQTDTTGDITGGYQLEIDQRKGEDFNFTTPQGLSIGLDDPDYSPETAEQTTYISDYVNTAENALFSANFTDPATGWRAYFDEAAAINFYIVNDVLSNTDGGDFFSSDYFYKSLDNPLLYMGPVWDFDVSSGNVNYAPNVNPTLPWMAAHAKWYIRLFQDPQFKADVTAQFNRLKTNGVFDTWMASIQQQALGLEKSAANNFGRWPMQGIQVWPNPEAVGSYDGEVAYWMGWLRTRIAYLDSVLNNKQITVTTLTTPAGALRQGTPVTLQAMVTASGRPLTGSISFLCSDIVLGTASLDAGGNASFTAALPAGADRLKAIYSGDAVNAMSSTATTNVTVLAPLTPTVAVLSSSVTSAMPAASVTFSAVVLGNSGGTPPSGSVSFIANGQVLGSAAVSPAGSASFSTTALPSGNEVIQAVYGGDSTFALSTSNNVTVTVNTASPPTLTFNASATDIPAGGAVSLSWSAINATSCSASGGWSGAIGVNGSRAVGPLAVGSYALTLSCSGAGGTSSSTKLVTAYASAPDHSSTEITGLPATVFGITASGQAASSGGLDGHGYAYAADLLTGQLNWAGENFAILAPNVASGTSGKTIPLPSGQYLSVSLLAIGLNGNQLNQTFVVNYTDGTQTTSIQNLSDWHHPQSYPGESVALNMAYRITPTGAKEAGVWDVYGYTIQTNNTKTVQSLTLPNNRNVVVLAVDGNSAPTVLNDINQGPVDNLYAIAVAGAPAPGGGIDRQGYAFAGNLLPSGFTWSGKTFVLGSSGHLSAASNLSIPLEAGKTTALTVLAVGVNGSQPDQTFIVTYSDGSTTAFKQSVSDWHHPQNYPGELIASNMAYRITPTGAKENGIWDVYAYTFEPDSSKTVATLTLPNNANVVVLAVDSTVLN